MQGPIQTKPVRAIYAAARGNKRVVCDALLCATRLCGPHARAISLLGRDELRLFLGMLPRPLLAQILKTIKSTS